MINRIQKAILAGFNTAGDALTTGITLKVLTGETYNAKQRVNVPEYAITENLRAACGNFKYREREDWGAQIGDRKAVFEGSYDVDTSSVLVIDGEEWNVINTQKVLKGILTIFQIRK